MELKIQNILKNYGLDKKEIDIYLASLELGPASMLAISKKSGIKRPTAYLIYKALEERGLMGNVKKSSGLHFFAKDPAILSKKAQQVLSDVNEIIPELRILESKNTKKPKITYYEGVENYKEVVEDILRHPNTTLYAIGSLNNMFEILTKKYDEEYYIPRRIKQKIKAKIIVPGENKEIINWMDHKKELREVRYLPKDCNLDTLLIIYSNKVVRIEANADIFITVVESEVSANDERVKFDLLWKTLKY